MAITKCIYICLLACLPVADIGLYIACILDVQALVVKYDDSIVLGMLEEQCEELNQLLPAEVVSDADATKTNVVERVTSGSASLVHFLVHGTAGGRADLRRCKAKRKKRVWEILSSFCPPFRSASNNGIVDNFDEPDLSRRHVSDPRVYTCWLIMCDCRQPSDREEDWAGLCLANDEVLSASELHEEFTKEGSDSKNTRTRLMTLCACSSGAAPREFDS